MARKLFGYYPPPDVTDPELLLAGATKMFAQYPREIVEIVCDPVRGLPARCKFAPTLAEIRTALESEYAPIARARAYEAKARVALIERAAIETDRSARPTYEELLRRCEAAGLPIGERKRRKNSLADIAEFRAKYKITDEQWAAIPEG
jgi:hypothetical protein